MLRPIRGPVLVAVTLGALAIIPSAASAAKRQCTTADLSAKVGQVDAGAGQRQAPLVLTNHSGHTCQTEGYVGLQLMTAGGKKLPTKAARVSGKTPLVTLKPGQKAVSTMSWTVIASGNEPVDGPCEGTPSDLLVIPPNQTTQTAAAWKQGPVCNHGKISITSLKKKG
jgi:hypothetical protein